MGTGTVLKAGRKDSTKVGELPAVEQSLRLAAGDVVRVTRDCTPAPVDEGQPPRIGCTLQPLAELVRIQFVSRRGADTF